MNSGPLAVSFPSRYPNSMQHLMAAFILTTFWNFSPAIAATTPKKTAKSNQSITLRVAAEYVLANGVDRNIEAPLSRSLGYKLDTVATKALRQTAAEARDKSEHAFYVVFSVDIYGGRSIKEIVLTKTSVTNRGDKKYVDAIDARIDSSGKLIAFVHAIGFYGEVKQNRLDLTRQTHKLFEDERDYQLTHIEFKKPTK